MEASKGTFQGYVEPETCEFNQTLVAQTHPADYTNPTPEERYNIVVIGGGTAGLVTAAGAAALGAKVALVERRLLGGDCLNFGCVPSKALIRSSRGAAEVKDAVALGIASENSSVDFYKVMERVRRVRSEISYHDSVERFTDMGVDIFIGQASFLNGHTVVVTNPSHGTPPEGIKLNFKKAVIATGTRAVMLPIPGLDVAKCLTNETVFSLTAQPKSMAIIGAGPIGCEMAQAYHRLGTEIHMFEVLDHVMGREDSDAADVIESRFRSEGINLELAAQISGISVTPEGKRIDYKDSDGNEKHVVVEEILLSVGRAPNTDGLNLEAVGVEHDKTGVIVDDNLRTSNSSIFAAGDIAMLLKFTHTAEAAARIVIRNALFKGRDKLSDLVVPWVTYTDPEVAHVGMGEDDAIAKGIQHDVYTHQLAEVDRAITDGDQDGFVKIVTDKGGDKILGAIIVARHAGEMINELTIAMVHNIGLGGLAKVIHPYPTQAEAIRATANAYMRTKLTPTLAKLFKKWLAWSRR